MLGLGQMLTVAFQQIGFRHLAQVQDRLVELRFNHKQLARDIQQYRILGIRGQLAQPVGLPAHPFSEPIQAQHAEAFGYRTQQAGLFADARAVGLASKQKFVERILGPVELAARSLRDRGEKRPIAARKNASGALELLGTHDLLPGIVGCVDPVDFRAAGRRALHVAQQVQRRLVGLGQHGLRRALFGKPTQQLIERGEMRLNPRSRLELAACQATEHGLGNRAQAPQLQTRRGLQCTREFAKALDVGRILEPIPQRPLIAATQALGIHGSIFAAAIVGQRIESGRTGSDGGRFQPGDRFGATDEAGQRFGRVRRSGFEPLQVIRQDRDAFKQHRRRFRIGLFDRLQRPSQRIGQGGGAGRLQGLQRSRQLAAGHASLVEIRRTGIGLAGPGFQRLPDLVAQRDQVGTSPLDALRACCRRTVQHADLTFSASRGCRRFPSLRINPGLREA